MDIKLYKCAHCGNIAIKVVDSGVPLVCCGEPMQALKAGSVDAAVEKHVPAVQVQADTVNVTVGEVEHPMLAEHWIEWVVLETDKGFHTAVLAPGQAPKAVFALAPGEMGRAVYAYCNLHGLWEVKI